MADTAVNTESWLMETAHKAQAGGRQQDAETEANVKDEHGREIVAVLSKPETWHTVCVRHTITSNDVLLQFLVFQKKMP